MLLCALPQVGECIGQYWRPNFDHHMYPYLPAHVTRPKEVRKLFVVPLPEKGFFEVGAEAGGP
jgi:cleavage and polyadenylation specificity factor subunit 5